MEEVSIAGESVEMTVSGTATTRSRLPVNANETWQLRARMTSLFVSRLFIYIYFI